MSACVSRATTKRTRARSWFSGLCPGLCLGLLAAASSPPAAQAYENDPFSNRLVVLADSAPVLNDKVNAAIADVAAHWTGPPSEDRFAKAVYDRIGGHFWVHHLEGWAMKSEEVNKLPTPRRHSFLAQAGFFSSRVGALFGSAPIFRVGDNLIGTDKLGHFAAQGLKFWRRWKRDGDETRAARQSAYTERAIFGEMTTGTYSNADLVSNYEGYRFYRSLFEDGVVVGKPAIVRWDHDHWLVQRDFDWNDHVNAYWDEGLDISDYDRLMTKAAHKFWPEFCGDWASDPARYTIPSDQDAQLLARYSMLELRPRPELRLGAICSAPTAVGGS
jgi:hypothetical protein